MTPEVQNALINAGRHLRLQIADSRASLQGIQITIAQEERHLAHCQARLDEIETALAQEGLALPPVRVVAAA